MSIASERFLKIRKAFLQNQIKYMETHKETYQNTYTIYGEIEEKPLGYENSWAGITLPLVRKVFGELKAKQFVSVQPMSAPSGLLFDVKFNYSKKKYYTIFGKEIKKKLEDWRII